MTLDISYTDFSVLHPEVPNWTAQTWGETGLKNVMDSVAATGSRRIDFRSYAAGPYWPTQVSGAAACTVAATQGLSPDFSQWNCVQSAVTAAHRDGIKTMGWFDLTEAHAGNPTAWALDHPQYCVVDRNGSRWDGPIGLVGNGGAVITRANAPMMDYNQLISGGFMTANCLRPDGAPVDPVLSYAYPEVNQYRLASINEMLATGVDGIYLVAPFAVGYEAPVVTAFQQKYGIRSAQRTRNRSPLDRHATRLTSPISSAKSIKRSSHSSRPQVGTLSSTWKANRRATVLRHPRSRVGRTSRLGPTCPRGST